MESGERGRARGNIIAARAFHLQPATVGPLADGEHGFVQGSEAAEVLLLVLLYSTQELIRTPVTSRHGH